MSAEMAQIARIIGIDPAAENFGAEMAEKIRVFVRGTGLRSHWPGCGIPKEEVLEMTEMMYGGFSIQQSHRVLHESRLRKQNLRILSKKLRLINKLRAFCPTIINLKNFFDEHPRQRWLFRSGICLPSMRH